MTAAEAVAEGTETEDEDEEHASAQSTTSGLKMFFVGVIFLGCAVGILFYLKGIQWVMFKLGRRSANYQKLSRGDDVEK